ncbi:MAG: hypothetical protein CBE00_09525 [Planctomycetaceae bacterium TMED240]|nr:hypothetical protein [Rhodopirellula sp.]OUX05639.1 MAG: hypothetical protein CBE00_09525 [Planctomycetaceae bacterium TMED240]
MKGKEQALADKPLEETHHNDARQWHCKHFLIEPSIRFQEQAFGHFSWGSSVYHSLWLGA